MNIFRAALIFCSLFFGVSTSSFAQNPGCKNAITNKYSGNFQDKYGNRSSLQISFLEYYTTHGPGLHKFGNNNALLYMAAVDKYENGQMRGRDLIKLWCVVNPQGKVLGLERDFD